MIKDTKHYPCIIQVIPVVEDNFEDIQWTLFPLPFS